MMKRGFLAFMILLTVTAGAAVPSFASMDLLVDCQMKGLTGDLISRGFYVPSYPGYSLSRVDLYLASDTPGNYTFSLSARAGSYDGPVIGVSTLDVDLSGDFADYVPASFAFPSHPAVDYGSLVTFAIQKTGGTGGSQFYAVVTSNCPVTQTAGTWPPLSSFRRNGVVVAVYGQPFREWDLQVTEEKKLKMKGKRSEKELKSFSDTYMLHADGSFDHQGHLKGVWEQKGTKYNILMDPQDIAVYLESLLLSQEGILADVEVKKADFVIKEKKDGTVKGKYRIRADVSAEGLYTKGKIKLKGIFEGAPSEILP